MNTIIHDLFLDIEVEEKDDKIWFLYGRIHDITTPKLESRLEEFYYMKKYRHCIQINGGPDEPANWQDFVFETNVDTHKHRYWFCEDLVSYLCKLDKDQMEYLVNELSSRTLIQGMHFKKSDDGQYVDFDYLRTCDSFISDLYMNILDECMAEKDEKMQELGIDRYNVE